MRMRPPEVDGDGARTGRLRTAALVAAGAMALSLVGPVAPAAGQVNSPPVAVDDQAAVVAGQSVTVHPLANDSDPDPGAVLALASVTVTTPGAGTATASGNSVLITAAAGFVGTMQAAYVVTDGIASTQGAIVVQVTAPPPPPNSPPLAVPDAAAMYSPAELRIDPRANDSDPDGDPISVTGIALTTPAAGTAALVDQAVVVRSNAGYAGPLVVTYTLADARGATAQGSITVTVLGALPNRRPVAVSDSATVRPGRTYKFKVLANDTDPDGDRIRLIKVKKHKKVKVRKAGSKVRFRARSSFSGKVRIKYRIKDARGAKDWGRLTVTVKPKPKPKPKRKRGTSVSKVSVERALARLGMPVGRADGRYDAATRRAVCAWRTIEGRKAHRGLPTKSESRAIVADQRLPSARSVMVKGVTISVTCQAAFWVRSDRSYRRVMAASTGKAGYRTRRGTFRVFISHRTWRTSTIYPEARMYKPMQFSGGQAIHGSATDRLVKTYPASHGCVRMFHRDINALQAGGFGYGSTVRVIGRW
jgi:lipoprotein-anchoring transpeptidase ErfK/SrfK